MALKDEYAELIKNLLPPGPAWPRDDTASSRAVMIDAIAEICAGVDSQASLLVEESDPNTCAQSFADWETEWGLPDKCVGAFIEAYENGAQSAAQRRAMLVLKSSLRGGQSAAWFEELARFLGRSAEVEELRDGVHPEYDHVWRLNVRDPKTNENMGRLNGMGMGDETSDDGLLAACLASSGHAVCETLDSGRITEKSIAQYDQASVMMAAKDPLATWGDEMLSCIMQRYRPAHTTLLISYT